MRLIFKTAQLTHVQVTQAAPKPVCESFGENLHIEMVEGNLMINGTEIENPKSKIAGLARAFGWTYHGGDAEDYADAAIRQILGGYEWHYDARGFRCGCVRTPLDELAAAFDWIAEQWGWL